jgi:hypothetical protein
MKIIILLVGILLSVGLNAQTKDVVEICAQLGETENVLPENRSTVQIFQKTIPAVVHIVYTPAIPNTFVPVEAIQPAIDQLNVDFQGTDISFVLVGYDYTNLQSYTWHDAYVDGSSLCFPSYQTQATQLANDISWDISEYCNIYVIPKMCSTILGYAYVGYGPDNADDGIWVLTKTFGTGIWDHLSPTYNENETLTHEAGHYCGLFHTFHGYPQFCGTHDPDIPCEYEGDYVCDTPPTKASSGCPGAGGFYCPIATYDGALFTARNHMDYGTQFCRDEFTFGQIERMHAMLEYQRYELYNDESVVPFCPGDFNLDGNIGVADMLVILSNWGCVGCDFSQGDVSLDYTVGVNDLNWILSNWGETCGDGIGLFTTSPISFEKTLEILREENLFKFIKFYDISGREILAPESFSGIIIAKIFLIDGSSITIKTVH